MICKYKSVTICVKIKLLVTSKLHGLPAGARGPMNDRAPKNKLKIQGRVALLTCTAIVLQSIIRVERLVGGLHTLL